MSRAIIFNLQHAATPMDNETAGIDLLNADSSVVFENIFRSNFKSLHFYACGIVKNEAVAEEMVQNVFLKLWEKRAQITIQQSLNAYLYKAVYYECLNFIKYTQTRTGKNDQLAKRMDGHERAADNAVIKELQQQIEKALNQLPEQCRTIFQLSRFEELKYRAIAERLGISEKTVENQMGKALKLMRLKLADYLPIIIITIVNLENILR